MSVSRVTRIAAFSGAAVISLGLLTACSSSDSTTDTASTPAATASSSTSTDASAAPDASASTDATAAPTEEPMVGGDPATWAPVELTVAENGTTVDLVVGQAGRVNDLPATDGNGNYVIESDKPEVVAVAQGDGSTTVPGFTAVSEGEAVIVVKDGAGQPVVQYTVIVTANDPAMVEETVTEETMTEETGESAPAMEEASPAAS